MLELTLKDNNGKVYQIRSNNVHKIMNTMNMYVEKKYQYNSKTFDTDPSVQCPHVTQCRR